MMHATILIFDSGLGGLTVFREIAKRRPDERYIYVADDAFFPYGAQEDGALVDRVLAVMDDLIAAHAPDLVVIACNTASTVVLPHLRARFVTPFVGTVPAIKPACNASMSRLVSVLGTRATVAREYTRTLIRDFGGGCDVNLVGSPHLAALAEAMLRDGEVDETAIAREIAPCFVAAGHRRTDTVVLACTHYPLLLDHFVKLAPWPVAWIDPAPAIARRVADLIATTPSRSAAGSPLPATEIIFTSGLQPTPTLTAALMRLGIVTSALSAA
jgi:glutamate racemase